MACIIIGQFHFCVFIGLACISVNKMQKRTWPICAAILTEYVWSIEDLSYGHFVAFCFMG